MILKEGRNSWWIGVCLLCLFGIITIKNMDKNGKEKRFKEKGVGIGLGY